METNTSLFEHIALFNHLSAQQCREIEKIGIIRHYEDDEIVFYEGEESSYFHLLIKGKVSVYKSNSGSEPIVIHHFRAPSFIAEVATLKQIPYPASCRTLQNSMVLKIARDPFLTLLQNDPSISIALIASLTHKISILEHSLQRHSAPNAMAKVARFIRDEREQFHTLKGVEISKILGITPETLSRMVTKLKAEGIIGVDHSKKLTLLSPDKLDQYCG
ncbi:Crp/Fnr family transcriptional regulator [Sulfuricurvum sp.]|uniref:Crp/Fnr family transcriptional regulator n=1 Tax=Sulfuricurvum sp. TaxID=2025608 RepID=UPI0019B72409|nr:Crp/Fnr family transcriptional regulator [Sulfuricurvum sp.]MBD3806475.1 Crp/Fnr family transcriptional regulator [Sulfuricurvum sp.]